MFNIENAKRRAAELGKLLGPIIVKKCGPNGIDGEVYYTDPTVAEERSLRVEERENRDTFRYRELILRAKDKDGDRIWDDNELPDILGGGVDPMDVAYIIGSMYAKERYKIDADGKSGPFDKAAAREVFESVCDLYGPVMIPGLDDEGEDLPIWYRNGNGFDDCAVDAIRRKYPDDSEVRVLMARALTEDGRPMFKQSHLAYLANAITADEMSKITRSMLHPRFMSEEDRIRLSVSAQANPLLDVDDLKN